VNNPFFATGGWVLHFEAMLASFKRDWSSPVP